MNDLINYLRAHIGDPLNPDMAADIMVLAGKLPTLVPLDVIVGIEPQQYGEFVFEIERMANIENEVRPLHQAHWQETEGHRHGLELEPDYDTFKRYEQAGRYVLFTMRSEGRLLGNCAMYLDGSTHTKTLIATEDTLFILPEARKGRIAGVFINYCETALKQMGVKEINVSVKLVNKAGRFFQMLGYTHVENGLSKILESK
jgi:N-acetylglutamate synthase-like GNAT family acetyltransferase